MFYFSEHVSLFRMKATAVLAVTSVQPFHRLEASGDMSVSEDTLRHGQLIPSETCGYSEAEVPQRISTLVALERPATMSG